MYFIGIFYFYAKKEPLSTGMNIPKRQIGRFVELELLKREALRADNFDRLSSVVLQ